MPKSLVNGSFTLNIVVGLRGVGRFREVCNGGLKRKNNVN